jgi:hypothetical protein
VPVTLLTEQRLGGPPKPCAWSRCPRFFVYAHTSQKKRSFHISCELSFMERNTCHRLFGVGDHLEVRAGGGGLRFAPNGVLPGLARNHGHRSSDDTRAARLHKI